MPRMFRSAAGWLAALSILPFVTGGSCSPTTGTVADGDDTQTAGIETGAGGEESAPSGSESAAGEPTGTADSTTDDATSAEALPDASTGTVTHTLSLAAGPSSEPIRPLLGVNAGPLGLPVDFTQTDLTGEYQALGVTLVRTHDFNGPLDMATIYPDQNADPSLESSYDFSDSDAYFAPIVAGGFDVYLRIGDSASTGIGYPAPDPRAPTNVANWIAAAVHVVGHYTDTARWGRNAVRYVEIWNEPDAAHFWDSTPVAFYDLFAQAAIALKAAYPELEIGGPGVTSAAFASPSGQTWIAGLLDHCQAAGVPLDFLSWHVYTNDPASIATATAWFRAQLDAHGYTATESHITEWNTDTRAGGVDAEEAVALRDGGRGAAIISACWIELQNHGVPVSTFYRGRDPEADNVEFYGLLGGDGRKKASALAFSFWSEFANSYSVRYDVSVSTSGAGTIYAIAGRSTSGRVAVLIANPTDQVLGCSFAGRSGTAELRRISDASDAVETYKADVGGVELPADSVQVIFLP
ncbi:MAG: hypothetical protein AMXMBFR47_43520 [Planctomycetota bacterium]